ncbi:MAG TPA: class I SAM-dependent RNA methyltransferase [Methyloceanibacter sp.]|nr:class I SAM-dependent RNA methyltransferase [Methyloceanibacter sp.]
MPLEVEIARLGAQGDGIAEAPDSPLFVPFTLPGERVRVALGEDGKHAALIELLDASPERIEPVCPHFGTCGGCALQHLEEATYLAWKRDLMVQALKSRGLDAEVEHVRPVSLGSRRRATFSLGRDGRGVVLGYRRARSHDLIDIDVCPILSPGIVARLPKLKAALAPLLGGRREARIGVTETETGLDIVVEGVRPKESALARLAGEAGTLGVARITVGGESLMLAPPTVRFGPAQVKLPPGAFLQASPQAEAIMTALVTEGVAGAKRIADLFAGLGTFALALAGSSAVDAYETDEAALSALAEAARHTPKLKPVRTLARDLFRSPLGGKELDLYDAVVFDPPRAGAASQSEMLSKSKVKRLVAVSCNPGTLARDLRLLVDGGYRITRVVPVDQFLFSSHVEVVAHLAR